TRDSGLGTRDSGFGIRPKAKSTSYCQKQTNSPLSLSFGDRIPGSYVYIPSKNRTPGQRTVKILAEGIIAPQNRIFLLLIEDIFYPCVDLKAVPQAGNLAIEYVKRRRIISEL